MGWLMSPSCNWHCVQHILKREVAKFEQQHILNGTALGELDHPNYASQYFKCLNLPNASHQVRVVSCWRGRCFKGLLRKVCTMRGTVSVYSVDRACGDEVWPSHGSDRVNVCIAASQCLCLRIVQVLEVNWKGDQLWGTIEILATPSGLLLWELYSQVRGVHASCLKGGMRACWSNITCA